MYNGFRGSGSGAVVRMVASDFRVPQFESNHQQNVSINKIIGDMVKTKFVIKRFIKLLEQKTKGKL